MEGKGDEDKPVREGRSGRRWHERLKMKLDNDKEEEEGTVGEEDGFE